MPSGILDDLVSECRSLTEQLRRCEEADFAGATRLPAWTVKELLGHLWRGLDRIQWGLSHRPPAVADADSLSYWRRFDPTRAAPIRAEHATEVASRFETGAALVADVERIVRDGVRLAAAAPPGRVVGTWGPTLRLDDFLATRLLEVAVHGLDLAHALDRPPWLTPAGSRVTRSILTGLLGSEPPGVQRMGDLAFIETGTGRRRLTGAERATLGEAARRFPLLA
jgi:uncharacterized protein (TIGR03083 family)